MVMQVYIKLINWCKNDSHIAKWFEVASTHNDDYMPVRGTNTKAALFGGLSTSCTHSALLANNKSTHIQDDCMRVRVEKIDE